MTHHHPQRQDWFGEHPRRGGWRATRQAAPRQAASRNSIAATPGAVPAPFAWQHVRLLWILDWEPGGWVLAELWFDRATCCYAEVRRARYRWQREAAGALLGRVLSAGASEVVVAAANLDAWLAANDRAQA
jgi:hypothetical protein